jgi:hypothetical protein
VPIYPGVQRRAEHVVRVIRAGLPRLWAVVGVVTIFIGGSALLALVWGIRHLMWGVVIALAIIILVLAEGSYRESRNAARALDSPRLKPLRELAAEGQAMRARLPERNKRGLVNLRSDLLRDFEAWKGKVTSALKPWPACLAQFQGQIHYGMSFLEPDRKSLEIEQRTKVLDQIVQALIDQRLG